MSLRDELRFVIIKCGAQSVIKTGRSMMLMSSVNSYTFNQLVRNYSSFKLLFSKHCQEVFSNKNKQYVHS